MGHEAVAGPASGLRILHDADVLARPVAQRRIHKQDIAVRAHPAVAQEVARLLEREEVLPCGHRPAVGAAERRLQVEVEWVSGVFVPEQPEGLEHLGVGHRDVVNQPTARVHRDVGPAAGHLDRGGDAIPVEGQRRTDLHLDLLEA